MSATEWLLLSALILIGVIFVLSLRKFSDFNAKLTILQWINLELVGKRNAEDEQIQVIEISELELNALITRHNDDFSKALLSRDIRYMSISMTQNGLVKNKPKFEDYLRSMQSHGWTSCQLINFVFVGRSVRSNERITVYIDETWQYRFTSGQTTQSTARNRYELLFDNEWKIESCEVLSAFPLN